MKLVPFATAFCFAAIPTFAAPLVPNQPVLFENVEVVCTGVGSSKDDPQWNSYPIRMVFSNSAGQFVSGVNISLSTLSGRHIGTWDCNAPWALLQLPVGNYKATATLNETGMVRSASFGASAMRSVSNQKRVEIQFPLPANQ